MNMIKQQLRTGDVLDETILQLYQDIPRTDFVPATFMPFAYSDMQIELGHHERMMTPLEEAKLLQALNLSGHELVLEVGTGTGFLTALLSRRSKQVISVDYYSDFTQNASRHLEKHQCNNVTLVTGDAYGGWMDKAPYDVIIYTGAIEAITESHRLQLLPGGKLFVIMGSAPIMQGQLHELDHDGTWHSQLIFETNLPALINPAKSNDFVF
jgi:protein-L-isoaspartate(D-aspartate) O-methyltransferase